jgi:cytidine deaminase
VTETVLKASLSAEERSLVQMAEDVIRRAHAPFPEVQVGSAVLTEREVYGGCTVESAISGLGICAERNAVNHAILHEGPDLKIVALSVAWNRREIIRSCGACLQYLNEFSDNDVKLIMAEKNDSTVMVGYFREMLPYKYEL